jgi:hypothetical protein
MPEKEADLPVSFDGEYAALCAKPYENLLVAYKALVAQQAEYEKRCQAAKKRDEIVGYSFAVSFIALFAEMLACAAVSEVGTPAFTEANSILNVTGLLVATALAASTGVGIGRMKVQKKLARVKEELARPCSENLDKVVRGDMALAQLSTSPERHQAAVRFFRNNPVLKAG